jgi:AraC-like DNA-binding protein
MAKHYTIPLVATRWLIELLSQKGVTQSEIISALALPINTRVSSLHSLPLPDYLNLLNWSADRLNDKNFGFTTADYIHRDAFGPALYMSFNTDNLRELFESLQQFDTAISQGLDITFTEGPITSQLEYKIILPTDQEERHDIEQSLAIIAQRFRRYVGESWRPIRVNFTHSKPEDIRRHMQEFGEEIHFEQASNSLIFDSKLLDTKITDADPKLLKILKRQTEEILDSLNRHENLISQLRYIVAMSLSSGECDSETAARHLNMSRRSLVRHLNEQGTHFRAIKDDVIQQMAKSALTETESNISQIAQQLGFSETSSFDRAFKKLTGYTPRQYRQRALTL